MRASLQVAIATPELIGVLAWWVVVLVAPLLLLRRWRRRRSSDAERGEPGCAPGDLHDRLVLRALDSSESDPWTMVLATGETRGDRSRRCDRAGRLPSATLEPLCRYVDFRRRLELAVCELEHRLSVLPRDRWRIDPYPLTGERQNTLLVLGETGVFVISATCSPGHWDDLVTVSRLARKIDALLPGYPGVVHPAICHPFASLRPRIWYREGESGEWIAGWLVGGDSVIEWLEQFGTAAGLSPTDLERFDSLSKPNWLKPAIRIPPTWPPVPGWSPAGQQE